MRHHRALRILRPSLALVALAALVVILGLALAGPAHASSVSPKPKASKSAEVAAAESARPTPSTTATVQRGAEVRAGEDVVVPAGDTVPSVTVFGGDVTVHGAVEDAVVAFGGDITVDGSVGTSVVAFGGDITVDGTVGATVVALGGNVHLGDAADVGADMSPSDTSVVVLGGDLTRAPGAQIHGVVRHSAGGFNFGDFAGWGAHGLLFNPLLGLSFVGWVIQTAFFLVLALVAAALMPNHLRRVQAELARRPWASLGWGALAFLVAVPVTFVVLAISVIGLLLWLPLGVFVLLLYFFGTTAVAAFVAQRVLRGLGVRENLMAAVALGVVGTTLVSRIPVAGAIAVIVAIWFGTGAAILAFGGWRRERREAAAAQAAAAAAAGWTSPASADAASARPVITPIVQTSPAQQSPPMPPPAPEAPATPPPPAPPEAPGGEMSGPVSESASDEDGRSGQTS